jgi:hypothetical protein
MSPIKVYRAGMSKNQSDDDPPLADYPGHSGSFGNVMHLSGLSAGDAQTLVRDKETSLGLLNKVRDDELPLLFTIGTNHYSLPDLDISRRTVAVEGYRRTLASTKANIEAIRGLRASVEALTTVTQHSSAATVAALGQSVAALVEFKDEAAKASNRLETLTKWLIVFTCAVVLLTVVLVVHDLTR